jgi:YhcH/YjgK/YiaL family protein
MIHDMLSQRQLYAPLHPRLAQALQAMVENSWGEMAGGTHRLDGELLFAMVNDYSTQAMEKCRWEAHRRYTDIQFMIRGHEQIGVAAVPSLKIDTPFNEEKDVGFFHGAGHMLLMQPGTFAIFFPHDGHQPGIAMGQPEIVRKVVLKVDLHS